MKKSDNVSDVMTTNEYRDYLLPPLDASLERRGFVNQSNYRGPKGERFTKPSKTVPDMSISLREMLNRHLAGGKVKTFEPVNVRDGSMVPVGLERMSAIDRAQLKMEVADFVATSRGKLITAKQARERAAFDERVRIAAEARIAAKAAATAGDSVQDEAV